MTENEVATVIVDTAVLVHRGLGPGLLESVYGIVLAHELTKRWLKVEREVPMPIRWDGMLIEAGFRADLLVEDVVIVELKSVEKTAPVHLKQVLTYLRMANKRLGLLINFGAALVKDGIHRVVNGFEEDA